MNSKKIKIHTNTDSHRLDTGNQNSYNIYIYIYPNIRLLINLKYISRFLINLFY